MNQKLFKELLLRRLKETLERSNYKRKGNTFIKSANGLSFFIGVQSSQSSTSTVLKATLNIEIASALITKLDDSSLPAKDQRHYIRRIGSYLETQNDKRWTIASLEGADQAADEILTILTNQVIPHLNAIQSTNDLADMLQGDHYIGITEMMRKHYLSLLAKATK